jgi:hypothetical protein
MPVHRDRTIIELLTRPELLVHHGIDVNLADMKGISPVVVTVVKKNSQIALMILKYPGFSPISASSARRPLPPMLAHRGRNASVDAL